MPSELEKTLAGAIRRPAAQPKRRATAPGTGPAAHLERIRQLQEPVATQTDPDIARRAVEGRFVAEAQAPTPVGDFIAGLLEPSEFIADAVSARTAGMVNDIITGGLRRIRQAGARKAGRRGQMTMRQLEKQREEMRKLAEAGDLRQSMVERLREPEMQPFQVGESVIASRVGAKAPITTPLGGKFNVDDVAGVHVRPTIQFKGKFIRATDDETHHAEIIARIKDILIKDARKDGVEITLDAQGRPTGALQEWVERNINLGFKGVDDKLPFIPLDQELSVSQELLRRGLKPIIRDAPAPRGKGRTLRNPTTLEPVSTAGEPLSDIEAARVDEEIDSLLSNLKKELKKRGVE